MKHKRGSWLATEILADADGDTLKCCLIPADWSTAKSSSKVPSKESKLEIVDLLSESASASVLSRLAAGRGRKNNLPDFTGWRET